MHIDAKGIGQYSALLVRTTLRHRAAGCNGVYLGWRHRPGIMAVALLDRVVEKLRDEFVHQGR